MAVAVAADVKPAVSSIRKFDCEAHTEPMQVLREKGASKLSYGARSLDLSTGKYDLLYEIHPSRSDPEISWINACGIGPLDDIVYCVTSVGGNAYLARFDEENMAFVAKLPKSRTTWRGAFSMDGTYHAILDNSKLWSVKDVASLPDCADSKDKNMAKGVIGPKIESGADIIVISKDLDGTGVKEYIVTVKPQGVLIASTATGKGWWWLTHNAKKGKNAYGSGWLYKERVFFSDNGGTGIYEIMLDTVDLKAKTIEVERVGPSVVTSDNDGMNCMRAEAPKEWVQATCLLWGEPHIRGFDAALAEDGLPVLDVLLPGDYWVVRSEEISIQGRYDPTRWTGGLAATSAIAVGGKFLNGHTLIVESQLGKVTWDGQEILTDLPSDFGEPDLITATYHADSPPVDAGQGLTSKTVDVELPDGVKLTVNRWAEHIDVVIHMPEQPDGQDGHCGNFNGDASDDTLERIETRMNLLVSIDQLMFPPRTEADLMRIPARVTLDNCPPEKRARAEELCNAAQGSPDPTGAVSHSTCVFDVCFGGDEFAAEDAVLDRQLQAAPSRSAARQARRPSAPEGLPAAGAPAKPAGLPEAPKPPAMPKPPAVPAPKGKPASPTAAPGAAPTKAEELIWTAHPELCLDFGGGVPENGAPLQLWKCMEGHKDMKFVLPQGGPGPIRWAHNDKFCLDVAGGDSLPAGDANGARLQFWACDADHDSMQFEVPAGGHGNIHWVKDPTKCLDVKDGLHKLGASLQLWTCADGSSNQDFEAKAAR